MSISDGAGDEYQYEMQCKGKVRDPKVRDPKVRNRREVTRSFDGP